MEKRGRGTQKEQVTEATPLSGWAQKGAGSCTWVGGEPKGSWAGP